MPQTAEQVQHELFDAPVELEAKSWPFALLGELDSRVTMLVVPGRQGGPSAGGGAGRRAVGGMTTRTSERIGER